MNIYNLININRTLAFSTCLTFTALSLSILAEFYWNIKPCFLCNLQRLLLLAICTISLVGLLIERKDWALVALRFLFIGLALLALYHLAVQQGLIKDPCAVPKNIRTVNDFAALMDQPISCSKIMKLFGFPVSVYNFILSLLLFFLLNVSTSPKVIN